MATLSADTEAFYNQLTKNLQDAVCDMDNLISFNNEIHCHCNYGEKWGLENFINDCRNIRNDISGLAEWSINAKNNLENMERENTNTVDSLPSREIAIRSGLKL